MPDPAQSAYEMLAEHAPDYLEEVAEVPAGGAIEITLGRFENSPLVLYAAAYYANRRGIRLVIKPEEPAAD